MKMTKAKTQTAKAVTTFTSITDVALQHGRAEGNIKACAEYALDYVKGFPVQENMSDENIEALKLGYAMAHKETYKAKTYAIINGQYFEASPDHIANPKVEKINVSVEFAMSFTANEMGTEFKDRPQLKEIIGKVRKAHQTYISDTFKELLKRGVKILKERSGIVAERKVVLFKDTVGDFFDAQEKSVKVKQTQRGDATAHPDKFKEAVKAFWTVYGEIPTPKAKRK